MCFRSLVLVDDYLGEILMGYLQQLAISDDGFIFDPTSGQSFTVSDTGLFILKGLKQGNRTSEQFLVSKLHLKEPWPGCWTVVEPEHSPWTIDSFVYSVQ